MIKRGIILLAFTTLCWLVFSLPVAAQTVLADEKGKPLLKKQYVDVQGSPHLFEEWVKGEVKLSSGAIYEGVDLMYDQVDDQLTFRNKEGQALLFTESVLEFTIAGRKFRKGYTPVDGTAPQAYYEVLVEGPVQLLKRTTKNVFEDVPYGSATKVKAIQTSDVYYISKKDTTLLKVKKDKKAVLAALGGKTAELEAYIKANRLDLKQDADVAKLVNHYNTL